MAVSQWRPAAQSASLWQLVAHSVAEAHAKPPGQGDVVPAPHVPRPSQAGWVSIPPAHAGVPQLVPAP